MEKDKILTPQVGTVYDAEYTAVKGEGAFLNDRPIRCAADDLGGSVVCFGTSPYNPELSDRTFSLARAAFELLNKDTL